MMLGLKCVCGVAIVACLVLVGATGVSARAAGGLAPDGDFEASPFASYYTHGVGTFTWATDASYSPTHSLKIVSSQAAGQLARWMTNITVIPVTPGVSYAISAYLKTAGVADEARLAVSFWDSSQAYTGTTAMSRALAGDSDWSLLERQAVAPPGSAFMRVEFRLYGAGTVWIDDLSVSNATDGPPAPLVPPSISGVPMVGQTLTGDPGVWAGTQPMKIEVSWSSCNAYDCSGEFGGGSLTPGPVPPGSRVFFFVTARNSLGERQITVAAGPVQPLPDGPPALTSLPSVSGSARVGETLRTTSGDWLGQPRSFTYRWQRCSLTPFEGCSDIPAADAATYVPTLADVGSSLAVVVTAANTHGSSSANAAWPSMPMLRSTAVIPAANLVPNPDVEATPDSYYTHGVGTFTWSTDESRSGSHSLKIVSTQAPGALARWMSNTDAVRVTPGGHYSASAWLKTSGVQERAMLSVTFWNQSWTYLGTTVDSGQTLSGTTDWTVTTAEATAPAGSAFVRVELRLFGPGKLWGDDVSVSRSG